jgi:hypothetical protein
MFEFEYGQKSQDRLELRRTAGTVGDERTMKHSRSQLADKSVYGNQSLADRIDGEKETFKSHGTEECRTVGRNEAGSSDFVAVQSQPCLCHRPYVSLSASDDDALRASRLQLKPFRQRSGHHAESSAGVHKEINVFDTSRRARQMSLYVKESHLNAFSKTSCILAQTPSNATSESRMQETLGK